MTAQGMRPTPMTNERATERGEIVARLDERAEIVAWLQRFANRPGMSGEESNILAAAAAWIKNGDHHKADRP